MLKQFLIFLLLSSFTFAMEIKNDTMFQELYKDKANDKKVTLMIYSATTCPQCAYMKEKVFKEPKVAAYLKKHFLILQKDIQKDELPDGFDYFGIPTIFFVDKDGLEQGKFIGSSRAEPFLQELKNVYKKMK